MSKMPGFFDIFFRPEPASEPSKPKPKPKKVKKVEKPERQNISVRPLRRENKRLKAELESLRQPKPEPESEADESAE